MTAKLEKLDAVLLRITKVVLEPALLLLAVTIGVAQGYELSVKSETLSLASCLAVLAFASFALNWARVSAELCPVTLQKKIYHAGLDAMLGSLLFVVSLGLVWLSTYLPSSFNLLFFWVHLGFVSLAVLISYLAMIQIIRCIYQKGAQPAGDR